LAGGALLSAWCGDARVRGRTTTTSSDSGARSRRAIFAVYEATLAITCLLVIRLGAYAYPARHHETPAATTAA
jgi:hypothetical protein